MQRTRRSQSPKRTPGLSLPSIQEEYSSILTVIPSSFSPTKKRTSSLITSRDYLDKLKLKASQMRKNDLVKVPPILIKLRQQKAMSSMSLTSKFPCIETILERLSSKALEAKEKQLGGPYSYEGLHDEFNWRNIMKGTGYR